MTIATAPDRRALLAGAVAGIESDRQGQSAFEPRNLSWSARSGRVSNRSSRLILGTRDPWNAQQFDNPLAQRRLRILTPFFLPSPSAVRSAARASEIEKSPLERPLAIAMSISRLA
jgi:hypothetical protein